MDKIAAEILKTQAVTDEQGMSMPLHSHTSEEQCLFLQRMAIEANARTSVEVGLAFGLSALFICEVLQKQAGARHIVCDPFQKDWHNVGLKNIREAGYDDIVDFHEDFSYNVLPKLLAEGTTIDFAYVDTTKVFDIVLVDVFYIHKLLRVGGLLAMDDCTYPGLNKVARFLAVNPCWKVYASLTLTPESAGRRVLSQVSNAMPRAEKIFNPLLLKPNSALEVNANCVVFQKVSEDTRNWDWNENF